MTNINYISEKAPASSGGGDLMSRLQAFMLEPYPFPAHPGCGSSTSYGASYDGSIATRYITKTYHCSNGSFTYNA